ncbi:fimbrial biogenesis chaperone [Pseudomonas aeruginosa]|uniref:fimbrial biogenesis chaperone n=1 Tax=Pseudomonas aeruginosa TaxID=287 RepID=UPI000F547B95|nr:fimbria/pilus periplasmic chaperone [Pseudomonas aeruginosa]RQC55888.1 molecular chaperone EcpD [Pseudomonas aeruginosa]RQF50952.1 molecular chaperone EcpD [Pseudomonas aeruginosa]RQI29681.1 molecular chaperone EcpD [Pseudomonas aeruginosa]
MRPFSILLLASLLASTPHALANVVIAGTRVIYQADKKEVTLQLSNVGSQPALVQTWVHGKDDARLPDDSEAPFMVMPPITRIGPGRSQTLRITYTGEPVPEGRESVYWLNVLDIPPRPTDIGAKNYLQVSIRSKIKLFFRPAELQGSPSTAAGQLEWSLSTRAGKTVLKVTNPSLYYVSLSSVELDLGAHLLSAGSGMVAPGQALELPLDGTVRSEQGKATVRYTWINDHGAAIPASKAL